MNKLWTGQKWFWKFLFSEFSDKYLQKRSGKCFISAAFRRVLWKWREARMDIDTISSSAGCSSTVCGNEEKPEWALTHFLSSQPRGHKRSLRGNEEKPEWALTHIFSKNYRIIISVWKWREARMGIDTSTHANQDATSLNVEMKRSPKWK